MAAETGKEPSIVHAMKELNLPPAKPIFKLDEPVATSSSDKARTGDMLGLATPTFTLLTSRGMPLGVRPPVLEAQLQGPLFYQLPYGDLTSRQDLAKGNDDVAAGCSHFWPHLKSQVKYCSFRNPLKQISIYGGDSVPSVDTVGGRKKVAPSDMLELQRIMRADIMAAPAEEVTCDVSAHRRTHRAVARAGEWLKEILVAKSQKPDLSFDWHVLASIQGAGDLKLREKACTTIAAFPVSGVWIGGLGYSEALSQRGKILDVVSTHLPQALPRFLPLNCGNPIEVLQAVLLGADVLEVTFPTDTAHAGIALDFDWRMPEDASANEDILEAILPVESSGKAAAVPSSVRQIQMRDLEWRECFEPLSEDSPVKQYSRAYLHHLSQVRELLGTILLVQHNLFVYTSFFEAIRSHIRKGTLKRFAAWFLATQTAEPPAKPAQGPASKKRRQE